MTSTDQPVAHLNKAEPNTARPRRGGQVATASYHVLMTIAVVAYLLPVLWALSMSLRTDENLFSASQVIPHPITLIHYQRFFDILPHFFRYFGNTLLIAGLGTFGTLFSSSLAGYALARLRFPGRAVLLFTILATLMMPVQVTLIPQYVVFRNLGLVDSPWPIIVPCLFGTPIAAFFFRQYFLTLPYEIEDAAAIDGAGRFRTFFSVVAPIAAPAYLSIGLLVFVQLWNSFFVNTVYLQDQDQWVLTQALQSLTGRYNSQYGEIMAGVVLVSVPILVAYLFLQRWIIRSIAYSGVTGG